MLGKIEGRRRREHEMVGWHHRLNGHEFEQTQGDGGGWGSLVCYSPWGHKESGMTAQLNNDINKNRLSNRKRNSKCKCARPTLANVLSKIPAVHLTALGIDGIGGFEPSQGRQNILFLATVGVILAKNVSNSPSCQQVCPPSEEN